MRLSGANYRTYGECLKILFDENTILSSGGIWLIHYRIRRNAIYRPKYGGLYVEYSISGTVIFPVMFVVSRQVARITVEGVYKARWILRKN